MTELARHFGLATLAIGIALVSAPALASLIAPTRVQCAGDEYVVGLTGRTGYWIDAVGPICARWDERTFQSVRRPQSRRPVGGGGGGMNQQSCPTGSAISGWQVDSVVQGDSAFADRVTLQCRTLAPPHDLSPAEVRFGGQSNLRRGGVDKGQCQEGELATGVSVWTSLDGQFVKHVALQCSRAPWTRSRMTSQNGPNGTVTYFSPELKIRSGDYIQLDGCRNWAANCGAPAADAFCASKGKPRAINFEPKPNVGLTVTIADQRICNQPNCGGFANIVCGPAQSPPPKPPEPAKPESAALDLVPLKLYWNASRGDNFVTATPSGASDAVGSGYTFSRIEACVFHTQKPGTVPLKLYWSEKRGDNFTTATQAGFQGAENVGYKFIRIEGYVWPSSQSGTIPLKLFWSSQREDNFTSGTSIGEQQAREAGYIYSRVEGYAYPASKCPE